MVTTSRLDGRINVLSSTTATTEEAVDDATEDTPTEDWVVDDIADETAAEDIAALEEPPVLTGVDEVLLPERLLPPHAVSMTANPNITYLMKFFNCIHPPPNCIGHDERQLRQPSAEEC
ncbi:MAG: hypothetical protein B0W54_18480 [Cellvibrio sp. 79]|nr:MAG: hypothetical protein B0W54_18480 [Cellvibrio sp. 79]